MKWPQIWDGVCNHYNLDPADYHVEFAYGQDEDTGLRTTTCLIYDGEARISNGDKPMATGTAFCASCDNFNKVKGRNIAFRRAFDLLKETHLN